MAPQIAKTLIVEAKNNDLDPLFLLAVIQTESHFNPKAFGTKGDSGLMQIMPSTGAWLARRLKIKAPVDLFDPIINIKLGAAHLGHLRKHFGPMGNRYLAAYNMGTKTVHRLLSQDIEPLAYAQRVVENYNAFHTALIEAVREDRRTLISSND